jgi:hypothetical protein
MSLLLGTHAAGFLLDASTGAIDRRDIARLACLSPAEEIAPGWSAIEYVTTHPIPNVDALPGEAPFRHVLLLRWGRSSLLALSHDYRVVNFFLKNEIKPVLRTAIRKNEIHVHELILHMTGMDDGQPAQSSTDVESLEADLFVSYYTLSFAAGRTDAFGEDLQKMQFYGDRISKATLFQDSIPLMRFYSCSLRNNGTDVVRLGRDGFVAFEIPSRPPLLRERLLEVNRILRSLTDGGYIA